MRKLWVILGLLLIFLATVLGGVFLAGRYLQSPEFKALVLSTLGEAMGSDVSLQEMDISVLNGISLRGVGIANPAGFPGDFFGAEQVVLRHRIWPLLSERVEIDRLAIERPHLTLVQSRDQKWNVELLQANWSRPPGGVSQASRGPLDIALSRFEIDHGELAMYGSEGDVLARGQDISLDSSVSFVEEKLGGGGELNLETLEIGETLFLNNLVATFGLASEEVLLEPVAAELGGGDLSGRIALTIGAAFRYLASVQLSGVDVVTLLEEADIESDTRITGKLEARADIEGSGGLSTATGRGRAELVNGTLSGLPAQDMLSALLQIPALREIHFDECLVEYVLNDNVLETPVVRLGSSLVDISGRGKVSLAQNTVDHDLTLVCKEELVAQMPGRILQAFSKQEDGTYVIEFRVWGPFASPRTDLEQRLLKGATKRILEEGFRRLFR